MIDGDIVRVKSSAAFEYAPKFHFGEVIAVDGDRIQIMVDMRYGHDSFVWVEIGDYEVV